MSALKNRSVLLVLVATALLPAAVLLPTAAKAQVIDITDISPDQSSFDATDPDGASGGRINGLATVAGDNDVFYAASEWGGLWKSVDGGDTWFHLAGHVPVATWDVEVDPNNARRVYATSYYDGRVAPWSGLNVSTDGGASWTRPASVTPPIDFCFNAVDRDELFGFGIAVDPAAPQNVYVGTSCGLAVSNDRGVTWHYVDPTPANRARSVWDVVVHHGGTIDVCGDDGHRRSTDGGVTWTGATGTGQLPSGRCSIAASPDEAHVLFAVSGTTIYESLNGGTSWQVRYGNPRSQGRFPFVAVNDRSGSTYDLWFGDVQLHRRTCTTPSPATPGGAARCNTAVGWTAGPFTRSAGGHDDLGDIAFDSTVTSNACPELFSSDGGVYVNTLNTSPGCHSPAWEQPTRTPHALWVWDFEGVSQAGEDAEDLYMGNQDNGSFGSRDAGTGDVTWNNRQCCDTHEVAADQSRVIWTVCCGLSMLRSNPGLVGGGNIAQPAGNIRAFDRLHDLLHVNGDDYVVASNSGVFGTTNVTSSPVSWSGIGSATTPFNACGLQVAQNGGTTTVFTKSGDCNGETGSNLFRHVGTASTGAWQQVTRAGGGRFGVYAVDPGDPNRILASDLAGATPTMVLTENGGTNWTVLAGLDTLMTGGGAYRYTNQKGPTTGQGNAVKRFTGYPQPTLVAFDPEDEDVVLAGAADAGLFLSVDGGSSWGRLTDPPNHKTACTFHLPRPRFAHFDHDTAGRIRAYVASQGRGVWRLTFPKSWAGLGANEADDRFGEAVATGDFDGDGLDDLAVGAPGESPGADPKSGYVFLFKGTSTGPRPWVGLSQAVGGLGGNEAGDLYGASLVSGDFNGDGFDDLAVGAPGESPGADPKSGYVFVYRGSATGLVAWAGLSQTVGGLGGNEADDRYGASLVSGDFDGDDKDDLAVGAPGESPGADPKSGYVFLYRGSATGLGAWAGLSQAVGGLGANEAGDLYGASLAAGDLDGDNRDDLVVGAPGEAPGADPKSGYVFVYRGGAGGVTAWTGLSQMVGGLGVNEADDRYGTSLAMGDFDGDGKADLVVGAPGESPGPDPKSGYAFAYRGAAGGPVPWLGFSQRLGGLGANEAGDLFAASLASGDFDGDGLADLASGAPGESPGADPKSGYVFTFKGTHDTLAACRGNSQRQ